MKKKSEEYVPCFSEMFEEDEGGKREVNRYTCTRCHRSVVSVVDGLCLECRNREYDEKTPASSMSKANKKLYKEWIKSKYERNLKTFSIMVGVFTLFSASFGTKAVVSWLVNTGLIMVAIIVYKIKKYFRYKRFVKYTQREITAKRDGGWTCPSCRNEMIGDVCCDICGVMPQLIYPSDESQ